MAEKSFDEMVASTVLGMQVKAAAGKLSEYQEAAFECAVQSGELKREVAKHFVQADIDAALDKREALHKTTQARIAQNPALLAALDPGEAKRQARAAEKAAELVKAQLAKATVEAAPCATAPAIDAPAKGNGKGKAKGTSAQV